MSVTDAFDAVAGSYDQARRRLVPCFDAFYGTAVEVAAPPLRAALAAGRTPEVLDLGAGTGLLSLLLTAAIPGVRLTLVDGAPGMLAVAAGHLSARGVPHRTVHADLADPLPAGRYDAVVSALAIHHLDDDGKRALYRRAAEALAPGGVFVNAEQVAGPTPALDRRYDEVWTARITELGSDAEEIAASRERMRHDRPATVADQCRWLGEAGLVDVDCFFKEWRFAVFGGRAPALADR
ncbi:class I SAM-dependent methyltransferase [Micromonospora sp. WMMD1128]|uniref:class I SAM-dependent methyltransferase n=1 Tax=Micromonospora sp. WMMD1128 TaxID=3015150 RepID=UPI00248BB229|nr:class I SAM-dependent methyltransferase [Micromonospora sp. WMMD1128]WBB74486.1 class I SAM-dependent methyltransferase [Micromonospora sp. WMMD1128]